jgi:16S rRNA (cytidine1402-2'-O)-methyltransferase
MKTIKKERGFRAPLLLSIQTATNPGMSGAAKLYLVATPIGNLEDITHRAVRILSEVDVIYAEDTRRTAVLLNHYQIRKPMVSCHEHNEAARAAEICERLRGGQSIALVSDAGTPGLSDPGHRIVRKLVQENLPVEVIPGPCAAIAALTGSGLPTAQFYFAGFLPQKSAAATRILENMRLIPGTLVIYESPYRVVKTLGLIGEIFPGRQVVLARELTKKFEEWKRGTAADLQMHFQQKTPKGEFVLIVDGASRQSENTAPWKPDPGASPRAQPLA